jgi:putative membrane protein
MRPKSPPSVVCLILLFVAAFGLTACNRENGVEAAPEDRTTSLSQSERDFMMEAAQADLAEIDMAQVALQNSGTGDVKDFANMIKSDHTSALEDLTELMKDTNVPQPKSIPVELQQDISRMRSLTGGEFDREFVNMIVSEHQKAIEMFRDQQSTAQNQDVKKYVEDTLPTLEMHLEKAQRLQTKVFSTPDRRSRWPV